MSAVVGLGLSAAANAADFSTVMGLWDFVVPESIVGTGGSGSATLTAAEDFDPSRQGNEVLVNAANLGCDPATGLIRFKDTRTYLATDGNALATFDVPQINAQGICGQVQIRTSTTFAEDRGTRVYVYTRALYTPAANLGSTGTWHISVFDLNGSLRWSREFRPAGGAGSNSDDIGWNIQVGRSAVGNLLERGARRDVIRVWRQRSVPPADVVNRYTYLDLLTGGVIRDFTYTITRPTLQ